MIKKHKKNYIIITLIILVFSIFFFINQINKPKYPYTQEYIIGNEGIKGEVNISSFLVKNKNYEIGANKYGYVVFKDPKKALKQLKKDYKDGIKLIQKEFNLLPLNRFNFKYYGTYGVQVTTGSAKEQQEARKVSAFMDIYENSFSGD